MKGVDKDRPLADRRMELILHIGMCIVEAAHPLIPIQHPQTKDPSQKGPYGADRWCYYGIKSLLENGSNWSELSRPNINSFNV